MLIALLVAFIWWLRSGAKPIETSATVGPKLRLHIETLNALLERSDSTDSIDLKRAILPEIERELHGIFALAPSHATALQLQAMLPEMKRQLSEISTTETTAMPESAFQSIDEMRAGLQKVAYGMVGKGINEEDKQRFKQDMTVFAAADPMVEKIAEHARAIVAESPGLLQSRIYVHFPGHTKEEVRYALYFAHELGWIHRRKKGSSYQLFPPGSVINAESE